MAFKKGSVPWNKGLKGFKPSPETLFKKGHTSWNTGKAVYGKCLECGSKTSIWTKREQPKRCRPCYYKLAYTVKEFHPRYKSDRSTLAKRQERNDSAYKEWRKSVRDRDGWLCKMANGDCLGKVVAHHILPWAKFPELRYELNNGITLCNFHHPRKREDEMRLSPYFQSLLVNEH